MDSVARCVQLTFNKDTLKAVRAFKENKFTQVCLTDLLLIIFRKRPAAVFLTAMFVGSLCLHVTVIMLCEKVMVSVMVVVAGITPPSSCIRYKTF